MRYRSLILCALSALLLSSCFVGSSLMFFESDTHGRTNLVQNPGFTPQNGIMSNWSIVNDESESAQSVNVDHAVFTEGKNSLRIDASPYAVMIVSDPFKVRRYGGYYIRVNARATADTDEKIELRFFTYNSAGKHINRFRETLRVGEEWKKATISAGFLDTRSTFGRVAIFIPPFLKGSIWIDDAGAWEVHSFKID